MHRFALRFTVHPTAVATLTKTTLSNANPNTAIVYLTRRAMSGAPVSLLVKKCVDFVNAELKDNDASHDYAHIARVRATAASLSIDESLSKEDQELCELAALLHDIDDWKYSNSETVRYWHQCRPKRLQMLLIHPNLQSAVKLARLGISNLGLYARLHQQATP